MSEKEDKLHKEIERQIDESIRKEERGNNYSEESLRNITKMQAPDQWPDPPEEKNEKSSD